MTKVALISDEPAVAIVVPVRLLPQLMAFLAVAATPAEKPCVETTAEEEPAKGPGVARALPVNVVPLRKAAGQ